MSGRDGKDYKQDMLVSIRYRNDLPPPPMPPKLLDIDTGGLAQYLDASFATGIVKREEPNIEADAEGGMPIDTIGMYGYFEGDEFSILAPEVPPVLAPEDEALMLTPEQLKAGGVHVASGTFLRKTQYITAASTVHHPDPAKAVQPRQKKQPENKAAPLARDDKENIKRSVQKAFDLAYPESALDPSRTASAQADRQAWATPVHPDRAKRNLKPVAFYPLLPDLDATTAAANSWYVAKFSKPPLPALNGKRDSRIDTAFMTGVPNPEQQPQWEAAHAAFERDPASYDDPGPQPLMWTLALAKDRNTAAVVKTVMDQANPDHDDKDIIATVGEQSHTNDELRLTLERARLYTNINSVVRDDPTRQMVVSLCDHSKTHPPSRMANQGSAAYYYPVLGVTSFRSDRAKVGPLSRQPAVKDIDLELDLPDQYMLLPQDPNPIQLEQRYGDRAVFDASFKHEFTSIERAAEAERNALEQHPEDELERADDDTSMRDADLVTGNGRPTIGHDISTANGVHRDVEITGAG